MALSMAEVEAILSELMADDLPVGEHMLSWSASDVRKYAEEGGFWTPEAAAPATQPDPVPAALSRQPTRLSLVDHFGWEHYEQHAIALDSPGGSALAAAMSDEWAVRCSSLMTEYEPQAEGSWCGIASLRILLRALRPMGEVPSQYKLHQGFIQPGRITPGGSMRQGLSMAHQQQLCEAALGKLALPHRVARHQGLDADVLARQLRDELRAAAQTDAHFLVNLLRSLPSETGVAGQGIAHWSPLAGYCERETESYALLLDVAGVKLGPHWLPLRLLAACMCTRNVHGDPRGFLRIEPPPPAPVRR